MTNTQIEFLEALDMYAQTALAKGGKYGQMRRGYMPFQGELVGFDKNTGNKDVVLLTVFGREFDCVLMGI